MCVSIARFDESIWNAEKRRTETAENVNVVWSVCVTLDLTWHYRNCVHFIRAIIYWWRMFVTLSLPLMPLAYLITSYAQQFETLAGYSVLFFSAINLTTIRIDTVLQ